jgi:protein-tyrosine phosphatase
MRVELPSGEVVQAHGLSGFIPTGEDETPNWALYLDEQWRERTIEWPHRFVDWPDFELPVDERDAFDAIAEASRRARDGQLVNIACDGGTGRTGTVLACLAVLVGISPHEAVGWVRSHYHPWAVESPELQEPLITRFVEWRAIREEAADR